MSERLVNALLDQILRRSRDSLRLAGELAEARTYAQQKDSEYTSCRKRLYEAECEQLKLTAERDALQAQVAGLTEALQGLHDDVADYARINNLGGFDNHWMKAARAALSSKTTT